MQYDDIDRACMRLPAVLDCSAAETLLAELQQRLQSNNPLRLDASEVEVLTLSCTQVLLAAVRSHEQLSIEQPSSAFVAAFEDFGLDWSEAHRPQVAHSSEPAIEAEQAPEEVHSSDQAQEDDQPMTKRILTIDDSRTIRDMLMLTLSDAGFEVLQAVDGQDGLDVLGKEKVDVVITDINMPKMDGYEVIRHLRRDSTHKTTPILVLTTESDTEKKNLAREAGATGWMVKPFDPDRLVATIRKVSP